MVTGHGVYRMTLAVGCAMLSPVSSLPGSVFAAE